MTHQSRLSLGDFIGPNRDVETTAHSKTDSLAAGNLAATIADAQSIAPTGRSSSSFGVADSKTDHLNIESAISAIAEAGDYDKVVVATAHDDKIATRELGTYKDASLEAKKVKGFRDENETRIGLDDSVTVDNKVGSTIAKENTLVNSRQTITAKSLDSIVIDSSNKDDPNLLTNKKGSDIIIEINSDDEKLIVEKMISRDERVIIVNAAKYLFKDLIKSDQVHIEKLLKQKCNCKKVKDYLIELLAEAA